MKRSVAGLAFALLVLFAWSLFESGGTPARAAGIAPPAGLGVSKGAYPDRIHLQWKAVEGAATYRCYRNPIDEPSNVRWFTATSFSWVNSGGVVPGVV